MKHLRSARHRRLIDVIVQAREGAGLSQRALAAKLKRSGSFVWKMESQEHYSNEVSLLKLPLSFAGPLFL